MITIQGEKHVLALARLKAFNRMVARNPELSARLIGGEHDFLQWQQARLFSAFREHAQRPGKFLQELEQTDRLSVKLIVSGFLACLLTILASLRFTRVDALVFSVDKTSAERDHDFRLDGLYRFLRARRARFVEIFHTSLGRQMLENAFRRFRPAVYHEAFGFLASLRYCFWSHRSDSRRLVAAISCEEFEEADRPFVRALAERTLNVIKPSLFKIRCYRWLLRHFHPRLILAIDDTRYYHEICAAAHAENVPFYAFQHGFFTKYHAGWLASGVGTGREARPDALFVWSPYWRKELLRLGTNFREDEIQIGGNPKGDAIAPPHRTYAPPAGDETMNILVPFESDAPFKEIAGLLDRLLKNGGVKIFLKIRLDWDREEQLRHYGLQGLSADLVEAVTDHASIIECIHAVAGVYSTFLYDALIWRKPVFIFKTSVDIGEGMIANGLAERLDLDVEDSAACLRAACFSAMPNIEKRAHHYMEGGGRLKETLEMVFGMSEEHAAR